MSHRPFHPADRGFRHPGAASRANSSRPKVCRSIAWPPPRTGSTTCGPTGRRWPSSTITCRECRATSSAGVIRDNSATDAIPLLILTDDTQANAEQYVLDCGADDYVAKSNDPDILLARIDLLLRRSPARRRPRSTRRRSSRPSASSLVDDSPTYLAFLEARARPAKATACSPPTAARPPSRWPARDHIDCAVIDLVMPGMDGIELCRQLSQYAQAGSLAAGPHRHGTGLQGKDDGVARGRRRRLCREVQRPDGAQGAAPGAPAAQDAAGRAPAHPDEIRDKELEFVRERAQGEAHLRRDPRQRRRRHRHVDAARRDQTFNKAAETIFGCSGRGGRRTKRVDADAGERSRARRRPRALSARATARRSSGRVDVLARRRDGSLFPAEFSVGEMQDRRRTPVRRHHSRRDRAPARRGSPARRRRADPPAARFRRRGRLRRRQ